MVHPVLIEKHVYAEVKIIPVHNIKMNIDNLTEYDEAVSFSPYVYALCMSANVLGELHAKRIS